MRRISYILIALIFSSCGLFKKSTPEAPVVLEPEADQPEIVMANADVCMAILKAIKGEDFKVLDPYCPTADVIKTYFPQSVEGVSDEVLSQRLADGRKRLEDNIVKLRNYAKEANVDVAGLSLKGCLEAITNEVGIPGTFFLVAQYLGESDTYDVQMVILDTPEHPVILEIIKTTGVFDKP